MKHFDDLATPAWYTQREVADRLAVSLKTVRSWRLQQLPPHPHKFHGALRYDAAEVEQFIRDSRKVAVNA
jgi:predicted site-specific integrase-resolvase